MAAIEAKRVLQLIEPLPGGLIPTIDDPPIGRQESGRSQEAITVPPVAGAGGGATGAQNTRRGPVDLLLLLFRLQALLVRRRRSPSLQPRFYRGVLGIEIGE